MPLAADPLSAVSFLLRRYLDHVQLAGPQSSEFLAYGFDMSSLLASQSPEVGSQVLGPFHDLCCGPARLLERGSVPKYDKHGNKGLRSLPETGKRCRKQKNIPDPIVELLSLFSFSFCSYVLGSGRIYILPRILLVGPVARKPPSTRWAGLQEVCRNSLLLVD